MFHTGGNAPRIDDRSGLTHCSELTRECHDSLQRRHNLKQLDIITSGNDYVEGLSYLTQLESLGLFDNDSVNDQQIAALSRLTSLTTR